LILPLEVEPDADWIEDIGMVDDALAGAIQIFLKLKTPV
jgi:hypothetical protein